MRKIFLWSFLLLLIAISAILIYQTTSLPKMTNMTTQITPAISPTSTADLSYILIVASKDANISLLNASQQSVGEVSAYNALTAPNGQKSGLDKKQLLYQKPESGIYTLRTTATPVEIYLYDASGAVNSAVLQTGKTFALHFDKQNSQNSSITQP